MGHLNALGFAEAVDNGEVSLHAALSYHLSANHYPPVPSSMIPTCIAAIEAIEDGDYDAEIDLPDGVSYRGASTAPAYAIAEQHHLDAFIGEEV